MKRNRNKKPEEMEKHKQVEKKKRNDDFFSYNILGFETIKKKKTGKENFTDTQLSVL